jgi:hypothetical protein
MAALPDSEIGFASGGCATRFNLNLKRRRLPPAGLCERPWQVDRARESFFSLSRNCGGWRRFQ